MDCARAKELFHDYIDGLLSDDEASSLEDHVARCPSCAGELEDLEKVVAGIRGLERVEAPEGFAGRLVERIGGGEVPGERFESSPESASARERGGSGRSTSPFFRVLPLAAAAVFLAALAVVFMLPEGKRKEETPVLADRGGGGASEEVVMKEEKTPSPAAPDRRFLEGAPGGFSKGRERPREALDRLGALFMDKDPGTGASFDCLLVEAGPRWKGFPGGKAALYARKKSRVHEGFIPGKSMKNLDSGGGSLEVYVADASRFQDLVTALAGGGAEAVYGCTVPFKQVRRERAAARSLEGKAVEKAAGKEAVRKKDAGIVNAVSRETGPVPVTIWARDESEGGGRSALSGVGGTERVEEILRRVLPEERRKDALRRGAAGSSGSGGGEKKRIIVILVRKGSPGKESPSEKAKGP